MQEIAFYSFITGALANLVLLIFVMINWQKNRFAVLFTFALTSSLLWNILLAINTQNIFQNGLSFLPIEALRYSSWIILLFALPAQSLKSAFKRLPNIGHLIIFALIFILAAYFSLGNKSADNYKDIVSNALLLLIIIIIIGIYAIEALYRGTPAKQRKSLKLLCIGIVVIFVYDLYIFSYLSLFEDISFLTWGMRGIISAISIPFLTLAIVRNPNWSMDIFISRQVVTSSFALVLCSIYLAALVFASSYVKSITGDLADFFLALFIFSGLICLCLLLLSKQLRYQFSTFINKHFFKNKYDYRLEWLRLINTVSNQNSQLNLEERAIKVLVDLAQTNSGLLWSKDGNNHYKLACKWNTDIEIYGDASHEDVFVRLLADGNVVIFDQNTKNNYTQPSPVLNKLNNIWLAVPLIHEANLIGFIVLDKTPYTADPNWEDLDIFKTIGRQLASYLMERSNANALGEAKQFEAFHQTTTFIIHDLRNLISQQSLLTKNAIKHKDKPEFIDDMIDTIENSVQTMQKLVGNLHTESSSPEKNHCQLKKVLKQSVDSFSNKTCKVVLSTSVDDIKVSAQYDELLMQIGHIIRNAQQANSKEITITTDTIDDLVEIVFSDDGDGMTEDFIKNMLFKPFFTTKGAAGMGIGAYEVRKYAIKMGGNVKVRSEINDGTEFTISLPLYKPAKS